MAATETTQAPTSWWVPLVMGILGILVGIFFLTNPVATSVGFVLGIGVFWLLAGILDIVRIFQDRTGWGWNLFTGIIGIIAGLWIMTGILGQNNPLGVAFAVGSAFTWVLGFMGIVYGIVALVAAFMGAGWWPGIMGVIGILFGLFILANTVGVTLALPFTLAILLIGGGIALIVLAFRLR